MFLLESSYRGDSNEYTRYTIFNKKKENHPKIIPNLYLWDFSKALKNEFDTAVVNELSEVTKVRFLSDVNSDVMCLIQLGSSC